MGSIKIYHCHLFKSVHSHFYPSCQSENPTTNQGLPMTKSRQLVSRLILMRICGNLHSPLPPSLKMSFPLTSSIPVLLVFLLLRIVPTLFIFLPCSSSFPFSLNLVLPHCFGVDNTAKILASWLHIDNSHIITPSLYSPPELLILLLHFLFLSTVYPFQTLNLC